MTPKELIDTVSAGKFASAYYFFGPEDFRVAEAEKFIAHKFLPDLQIKTNYGRIDGRKTRLGELVAELSSLPMLGERQVIVINSFQSYKPKEVDRVLSMIPNSDPTRVVIFTSPSPKTPRKDSAFYKKVTKAVASVEFGRLAANQIAGRVKSKLSRAGIEIERDALTMLAGLLCGNCGAMETEVAKLIDFKGTGTTVTVDDIKQVSSGYEVFSVFALADEIVEGRTGTVLKMIRKFISEGQSPPGITSLLQGHFLSLYLVKNGKQPMGRRNMPWLMNRFRTQGARYDNNELERIITTIAEADIGFRRQELKPTAALEMLALKIARIKS